MQKLLKIKKKSQNVWLTGFSTILISCASLQRPSGYLCTIDMHSNACYCSPFGKNDEEALSKQNREKLMAYMPRIGETRPLEACDKMVSFSLEDWLKIQAFIDELELSLEENCEVK